MNWDTLLKSELELVYHATQGLIDFLDEDQLDWKPAMENNWMTHGQLLMHITSSCGFCFRGFVTGDWGLPEGKEMQDLSPEEMLPPAEKMPTVHSIREAKDLLEKDRQLALEMLGQTKNEELDSKILAAPWAPDMQRPLGQHLLQMIGH
ncbi:DinB family protein, partial [bacterium]|nr:DinB family protein [bacterium]